ncbi:MAG TPA: hypothetical protein VLM38_16220 [Blastocatellia bacterium]|nr:hypothetical protein [Blastocatellia bacterium]
MKIRPSAIGITLIAALLVALIPIPVGASSNGKDERRPIHLSPSTLFGPIGRLQTTSLSGTVAVDGRVAQGSASIWGGELIRASGERSARVDLDSLGQVTLERGAAVRLSRGRAASGNSSYDVLVASLITGSMRVNLNENAGAYVEAGASSFIASPGASFNIGIEASRAALTILGGEVKAQDPTPPQDVNIRVVDELGRPVSSGSQLSVRARSTRQIQVQVTDKNDKPLPDLPVLFSLGDPCLGSLGLGVAAGGTFRQKTDKRGIASVPLVTGAARCAASILAKVEGTNASVSIQTNVVQGRGFWTTQNTLIVVAAAAAAGIATGLVVANSGSSEPIRAVPPPKVNP